MGLFEADAALERRLVSWWKRLLPSDRCCIVLVGIVGVALFFAGEGMPSSYLQQERNRDAACAEVLAKTRATGKSDEKTVACMMLIMGDQVRLR
jgi:hypothetical protein